MSAANTSVAVNAAAPAPAPANAKGGLLGGLTSLFGGKAANAKNASANASANAGANAKNAGANAKNASANASANAGANAKNAGANANKNAGANANKNSPPALKPVEVAASLNAPAKTRRRQRGGARGKTMRLPGPRNVLRVTGKTVGKVRNVGVYGLKKVGNGVLMVTGLLGSVLRKGGKTLKGLTKRRQQTRKQ